MIAFFSIPSEVAETSKINETIVTEAAVEPDEEPNYSK